MSSLRQSVFAQPTQATQTTQTEAPVAQPTQSEGTEGEAPLHRPTEAQVRAKSRFWSKWADAPLLQGKEPTLALAIQLTGSSTLSTWWSKPGFKEWFLNAGSNNDRLDWLLHLALNAAQDILLSDDPRGAGARVQMIKAVTDLMSRKAATAEGAPKNPQKAVASLSKEELLQIVAGAAGTPDRA